MTRPISLKTAEEEAYTLEKIRNARNDLKDLAEMAKSYASPTRCKDCNRYKHSMYCCLHCGSAR